MVSPSNLNLSAQNVKYLLFLLDFFMVLTGIILICVGSTTHGYFDDYSQFLVSDYFSIPTLLIVVGFGVIAIAVFGCYGALRENYCMILVFAALMVFVFVLEVIAGIYGYSLRDNMQETVAIKMHDEMLQYQPNNETTRATVMWDTLQKQFGCCGTNGPKDWQKVWKNQTLQSAIDTQALPYSCCEIPIGAIGQLNCSLLFKYPIHYSNGCLKMVSSFLSSHAFSLGAAGIGVAFFQLLGIGLDLFLAKTVRKSYLNM